MNLAKRHPLFIVMLENVRHKVDPLRLKIHPGVDSIYCKLEMVLLDFSHALGNTLHEKPRDGGIVADRGHQAADLEVVKDEGDPRM